MDFNVEEEKKSPLKVERMHFLIVLLLQLSSFPEKRQLRVFIWMKIYMDEDMDEEDMMITPRKRTKPPRS